MLRDGQSSKRLDIGLFLYFRRSTMSRLACSAAYLPEWLPISRKESREAFVCIPTYRSHGSRRFQVYDTYQSCV